MAKVVEELGLFTTYNSLSKQIKMNILISLPKCMSELELIRPFIYFSDYMPGEKQLFCPCLVTGDNMISRPG